MKLQSDWLYTPGDSSKLGVPGPLERRVGVAPGFNCGPGGALCKHEKKGDHGRHNDEFRLALRTLPTPSVAGGYVVATYEEAVVLTLFSARYEGAMEADFETWNKGRHGAYGASLDEHMGYVYEAEGVRNPSEPMKCDYLRSGRCYGGSSSGLLAQELWTAEDDAAFLPMLALPDTVELMLTLTTGIWERIGKHLREVAGAARKAHEGSPKQCSCCGGTGLVPRSP